jgi:hypothetical protein
VRSGEIGTPAGGGIAEIGCAVGSDVGDDEFGLHPGEASARKEVGSLGGHLGCVCI